MQRDEASIGLQRQLPSALQLHILSLLPPNDRALSGRLVSPDAANDLSGPEHCTASLSQPLPPHAVPWAMEAGQQHVRQLPFRQKLQLLCTAAASGSEVNLEVALALLQPSILPELLQSYDSAWARKHVGRQANPGAAAVTAGHPQLLGWLLSHCPGLVECWEVLAAAAEHCDLEGLQAAFRTFSVEPSCQGFIPDLAAGSGIDAVAKMEWLMSIDGRNFVPYESTAKSAACSGDLGRLRWLRERGCFLGSQDVLCCALRYADLAVAQWLVDEAGCVLPPAADIDDNTDDEDEVESKYDVDWGSLLEASACSSDGLAKVGWLLQRRGGQLPVSHWQRMAEAAAWEGRVEMVRHALSVLGQGAVLEGLAYAAVTSGSVPMVQFLHHAGAPFDGEAYLAAARTGSLAMVRWLACEGGVSAAGLDMERVLMGWPRGPTAAASRELLQAVQLLVEKVAWPDLETTVGLVQAAARRGDFALAQYLLQQLQQRWPGYQPAWGVGKAAVEGGCEALLEWLVEQYPRCLTEVPTFCSLYGTAAVAGDLGTLTVLRRLGVPWGAEDVVARVAARDGCPPAALHWLVEQGTPVGSRRDVQQALDGLGKGKDRGVKDWLLGLVGSEAAPGEEA